jgi:hypothetical protein
MQTTASNARERLRAPAVTPHPGPWLIARRRDQDYDFLLEPAEDAERDTPPAWTRNADFAQVFRDATSLVNALLAAREHVSPRDLEALPASQWGIR